jgi:hypothetical protein
MSFRAAEAGFDPQRIDDRYSVGVCENLRAAADLDYLARPVRLVPLVVESGAGAGGGRHALHLPPEAPGFFADDPAFKGQKRELVAKDVEYAISVPRPEAAQPLRVALRAQDRGAGRGSGAGKEDGQVRLRREGRRAGSPRPLHDFLQARRARLQLPLRDGHAQRGAGGPRGDRVLRRRHARTRSAPGPTCSRSGCGAPRSC